MLRHAAPAACAALLVLIGAVPRIALAGDALPEGLRPFVWSDVLFTWTRGLAGGRVPYWNAYFEYPPLAGYVSGALSLAAPSALGYVVLWSAAQAAAAGATVLVLARQGARTWAFALAPELALLGPINVDLLAVLALVLAVHWARRGAALRSVGALAAGAATKLFPTAALAVPLLGQPFTARAGAARLGLFGLLVAACYAPAAGAPYSSLESIGRYSVGIGANFDSLWGMAGGALSAAGVEPAVPILAVTAVGLVATYAAFVLPLVRTGDPAVPMALATITVLLWSRLYSPQFSLWVLPFFALLPLPRRVLALLIAADVVVFLTVYPLTLVDRAAGDPTTPVLLGVLGAAVLARHGALVLAFVATRRLAAS